jgi:uridine phosphorylase
MSGDAPSPPILAGKHYAAQSAFTPESLLREARRQKRLTEANVPPVCVLDPDGDIVAHLLATGRAQPQPSWACYHTDLSVFAIDGYNVGIVGRAVGAPFAVLVAEELFASGCELLLSVTSSGQITPAGEPPYFVLIERALRDEGTSYHYLPTGDWSTADATLVDRAERALAGRALQVVRGATWTTDAPFRETAESIAAARARGVLAVEMEAAALYAFAAARGRVVLCVAYVTNQMGRVEGDFEKGEAAGAANTLRLIECLAATFLSTASQSTDTLILGVR